MKIDYIKIADIKPYALNAKKHPKSQIAGIAESLKRFGWKQPVVVDSKNNIVIGHGRVEAAKLCKMETVPCVVADDLSPDEIKALRLIDNRIAETGWDVEMLALDLQSFALDLTPFNIEFDSLLPKTEVKYGLTDPDAVPDVQEKSNVQIGDMFALGNHRIICGDSTKAEIVEKLLGGEKCDLVITDPPYNIETQGGKKGDLSKSLRKQGNDIDFISDFDPKNFLSILPMVFDKNKMNAYVFCNKELLPDYLIWARDNKISFNVLVWKKPNAIPIGDSHRPDIEYLLLFRKSAIWNRGIDGVNYSRLIENARETGLHPTMKPVAILENEILISSNKNSIVLDFFGGSGSTIIACEKTSRICRVIEIEPRFVDVAIKRWQDFTGQLAKKL